MSDNITITYPTKLVLKKENLGKCYELAFRFIMEHRSYGKTRLVHGIWGTFDIDMPPFFYEHAWVKLDDGLIYEPVSCQYLEEEWCRTTFYILEARTYTFETAMEMRIKHHCPGPWEFVEKRDFIEGILLIIHNNKKEGDAYEAKKVSLSLADLGHGQE